LILPTIAIIGRPNVGKSTLVNRLCQSNDAIVFDKPGVTRDRTYQNASWGGKEFQIVDTGGLVFDDDSEFLPEIRTQVFLALEEASLALLVVDGNQGVTDGDLSIAKWLRNSSCKTIVAVNKCESTTLGISLASEFWKLGLGEPYPVSAIHGSGTGDLLDLVIGELPENNIQDEEEKIMMSIIGRPNVGKSTLVNRLCQSNDAIVFDKPGVTRDRTYQNASWGGKEFQIVDTGGLVFDDDSEFLPEIRTQVFLALEEASLALLVVDGNQGVTDGDLSIAKWLRNSSCKTIVAVNKCESTTLGISLASEFWKLGLGEPNPVSAIHGSGTGDLLDLVIGELPENNIHDDEEKIMMSIIGRPNVGKSSLLNSISGEKRAIVSDISGTTTDSIDTLIKKGDNQWKIVDTAGIRRKKNVKYGTEFFGINRAFKSIDRSDVCVLVIDAVDGVTDQDQKLAGRIEEQGRACIIVVNKWDLVEKNSSTIYQVEKELRSKLYFLHWSKMIFISALTGQRVDNIFEHALNAVNQHRRRVTTSVVNEVLKESISWKSPPTKRSGKQGRLYYGTQVKNKPPTFTLFVNDPKLFGITYRRYIEKQIRVNLGFEGTPLILLWRGKQQRALNKEVERENIELIQKD